MMPILVLDSEKCTGCLECMKACSLAYERSEILELARLTITKKGDIYILENSCRNCEDAPCIKACPEKAISVINNRVLISPAKCKGWGHCIEACPFNAIKMHPKTQKAIKCTYCGICVKACPEDALSIVYPNQVIETKRRKYTFTVSSARKWI